MEKGSKREWQGEKLGLAALGRMLSNRHRLAEITVDLPGARKPLVFASVANVDALMEGVDHEDDIPFWAEVWDAALGLTAFMAGEDLEGLTALELGCGVGVCGIFAAARGAIVTQVDNTPAALEFCRYNALANSVTGVRQVLGDIRRLDMGRKFDRIIGSDILYEPKLHEPILAVMSRHLEPGGRAWFADPGRKWASAFVDKASGSWLYALDEREVRGRTGPKTIDIITLTRR